jgi:enolase
MAFCRALAFSKGLTLYKYINSILNPQSLTFELPKLSSTFKLPKPSFLLIEGKRHGNNNLDIKEFMVIPEEKSFLAALKKGEKIYNSLKNILINNFGEKGKRIGLEGGFDYNFKNSEEAFDLIKQVIEENVKLGVDCASSEFFNGSYNFEGKKLKGEELASFYDNLIKKYPIEFLEDPFSQDDFSSWQFFAKKRDKDLLLIGDDLTVTNPGRIEEAEKNNLCNGVVIKPNQIGTITETIRAVELAKSFGWKVMVSHRSGETLDSFIADLAVGVGADFIKSGAPQPKERMVKYARLAAIEEEIKAEAEKELQG